MQLDALPIEFLLNYECGTLHILNGHINLWRWPLAKHRRERPKELDCFVLHWSQWLKAAFKWGNYNTSSFNLLAGSHNSQVTFFRSEHVLNRSWASGWKTENTVVSFTWMFISADSAVRRLNSTCNMASRKPFKIIRASQRCSSGVVLLYTCWSNLDCISLIANSVGIHPDLLVGTDCLPMFLQRSSRTLLMSSTVKLPSVTEDLLLMTS